MASRPSVISIEQFINQHHDHTLHAGDFEAAGFYSVNYGRTETHIEWSELHKMCQSIFGHYGFMWTGSIFWFENENNAFLFKCLFNWGLGDLARNFHFAIRVIEEEYTRYNQTEEAVVVAQRLRKDYGVRISTDSLYMGRWIGLQSERDAMYARLMLPNHVFVKLHELRATRMELMNGSRSD
jgi:hypothetical protein